MKVSLRRVLVLLLAMAIADSAYAQEDELVAKPELKAGFRDQVLGADLSELDGAKCEDNKKGWRNYTRSCRRKSDHMRIADVQLTDISYVYLEEKLWFVSYAAKEDNCEELASVIRSVYGEPTWDKSGRLYYGSRTSFHIGYEDGVTKLTCLDRPDVETCGCDIRSVSLQRRYIAKKREDAAGDL